MSLVYIDLKPSGFSYRKLQRLLEQHKKGKVDSEPFEELLQEVVTEAYEKAVAIAGHYEPYAASEYKDDGSLKEG